MKKLLPLLLVTLLILPSVLSARPGFRRPGGFARQPAGEQLNLSDEQKESLRDAFQECSGLDFEERKECMQEKASEILTDEQQEIIDTRRERRQVIRQCRKSCRESFRETEKLEEDREEFRTCRQACRDSVDS